MLGPASSPSAASPTYPATACRDCHSDLTEGLLSTLFDNRLAVVSGGRSPGAMEYALGLQLSLYATQVTHLVFGSEFCRKLGCLPANLTRYRRQELTNRLSIAPFSQYRGLGPSLLDEEEIGRDQAKAVFNGNRIVSCGAPNGVAQVDYCRTINHVNIVITFIEFATAIGVETGPCEAR